MNLEIRSEVTFKNEKFQSLKKGKNMIAVASGKGDVGKTWFAVTLAHAFSFFRKKTLFFDCDLGIGNITTQLGLPISNDIDALVAGDITLNQIIYHCEKTKVDIIAGNSCCKGLASFPTGRLQIIRDDLMILAPLYDNVIIDAGEGVGKGGRIMPSLVGKIIVLCTSEPESITEAYAFIKVMTMQYPKTDINIVVNKVITISEGNRTYGTLLSACQNYLNVTPSLLGVVRKDTRVRDAIRNQVPMINRYPTSEATEDVMAIAKKILEESYV